MRCLEWPPVATSGSDGDVSVLSGQITSGKVNGSPWANNLSPLLPLH